MSNELVIQACCVQHMLIFLFIDGVSSERLKLCCTAELADVRRSITSGGHH